MKNECSYPSFTPQKLEFFGKKWKIATGGRRQFAVCDVRFTVYNLRFAVYDLRNYRSTIPPATAGGTFIITPYPSVSYQSSLKNYAKK